MKRTFPKYRLPFYWGHAWAEPLSRSEAQTELWKEAEPPSSSQPTSVKPQTNCSCRRSETSVACYWDGVITCFPWVDVQMLNIARCTENNDEQSNSLTVACDQKPAMLSNMLHAEGGLQSPFVDSKAFPDKRRNSSELESQTLTLSSLSPHLSESSFCPASKMTILGKCGDINIVLSNMM